MNVPLWPGATDEAWLTAFRQVVPPIVKAFGPDVLVTQLGCDTHATDPLAQLRLTTRAYRETASMLHGLAHEVLTEGRWVATGGGGYQWARVAAMDDRVRRDVGQRARGRDPRGVGRDDGGSARRRDADDLLERSGGRRARPRDQGNLSAVKRTCFPFFGLEP